jgi:hypothetical protein
VAIALLRFITVGAGVIGERSRGGARLRRVRMGHGALYNSSPS